MRENSRDRERAHGGEARERDFIRESKRSREGGIKGERENAREIAIGEEREGERERGREGEKKRN